MQVGQGLNLACIWGMSPAGTAEAEEDEEAVMVCPGQAQGQKSDPAPQVE